MGGAPCVSDQAIHVHSRAYLGRLFGDTPMSHKRLLEPSSSQSRDMSPQKMMHRGMEFEKKKELRPAFCVERGIAARNPTRNG